MNDYPALRPAWRSLCFVLVLGLGGCLNAPTEPNQTAWQATLSPASPGSSVTGTAGAVSDRQRRRTEAVITVSGADAGALLPWRIRIGVCGQARGAVVGAAPSYPALEVELVGENSQTTVLTQAMTISESYMVEVWSDGSGDVVLACGPLNRL